MRIGGWVWFVAGIIFGELLRNGVALAMVRGLIGAIGRIFVYLGDVGTVGLVVITALVFWVVTRTVTENSRARFDMDLTWKRRKNYRLPKDQRQ